MAPLLHALASEERATAIKIIGNVVESDILLLLAECTEERSRKLFCFSLFRLTTKKLFSLFVKSINTESCFSDGEDDHSLFS